MGGAGATDRGGPRGPLPLIRDAARHLRQRKTLRWHIDYLIAAPGVRVVGVARSGRGECALSRAVRGRILVAGFGASDCRAGCGAHLKYLA